MRILQLHCNSFEFTPEKKEIKTAEEIVPATKKFDDLVVAFVAVEQDDDSSVAQKAVIEIAKSTDQIGCKRLLIYPYAHLSSELAPPTTAVKLLKEMEDFAKDKMDTSRAPFGWTKSFKLDVKGHPLAENSKTITKKDIESQADTTSAKTMQAQRGHKEQLEEKTEDEDDSTSQAVKAEETITSYWYVMEPGGKMTKVEDFDFANKEKLHSLADYEIAKKRTVDEPPPHVKLMKKMGIADYESASDPGNMKYYPNGRLIKSLIERFVSDQLRDYGAVEVETPIMYDAHHPSMASYFNRFPARQYNITTEGKKLFLRFAACFGQFLMANDFQLSHKNMPLRLYEITRYSFRREQSGELVGLKRLRAFTMPDCHALCKDMEQAKDEFRKRFHLSHRVINDLGISDKNYEMAIRFTEEFYNENKALIKEIVDNLGKPVLVEMWKEKFFYFVLKWEFNFVDNLGKASALSTDQIDVENGKRYNIEFVDENNTKKHPIILHNSPSGAVERVMYGLLEVAAQDSKNDKKPKWPLWLSPTQVRLIPVKSDHMQFCSQMLDKFTENHVRADLDDRNESVGKRIRDAETEWIRYTLVVGDKEVNAPYLHVRDREQQADKQSSKEQSVREISFDNLVDEIHNNTKGKPFSKINTERYLSRRPQLMI